MLPILPLIVTSLAFEGPIVISEIRIDQPGADNDEYVELAGPPGASLDGISFIVIGDGSAAQGSGTIEVLVSLAGQVIPESGYFVIAESSFSLGSASMTAALNFENGDNVTHMLVRDLAAANGADLDADNDCVIDREPWSAVLDAVSMLDVPKGTEGADCVYGTPIGPSNASVPMHVFRCPGASGGAAGGSAGGSDGGTSAGLWVIGSPDPATGSDSPGKSNPCTPQACIGDLNGDGDVGEADLTVLLAAWGMGSGPADLDLSGDVNGADLHTLLAAWGACGV